MSGNQPPPRDAVNAFGPAATHHFDFTPFFEDTFLSIVPSILLLLVLPFRVLSLRYSVRKVVRTPLYENKLLFLIAYACLQTALLITSVLSKSPLTTTKATLGANILSLFDALALVLLSHSEHIKSIRPSAIINVYLLLTLPLDIARCRTLYLDHASATVAAVYSSAIGVKVMVLVTEAIEKRSILLEGYRHSSPEQTSGIYSRSFFFWLNHLMTTGFGRILKHEDLYPIEDEMTSETLCRRVKQAWSNSNKERPRALLWALLRSSRAALLYTVFPRLCLMGFRYAQPLLLSRTVTFADNLDQPDNIGWGLTAAFGVVLLGSAVANGFYYHMSYRFIVMIRGSLVGLIYDKTMDLSIIALNESAAVTLMSNDTEAICVALQNVHEVWAAPIELAIALYLLERQLGLAFLAAGGVAAISTLGIVLLSNYMAEAQKIWIQGIQTRVDATASMLAAMKPVKMLGFTPILQKSIQHLRSVELHLSTNLRKLLCIRILLGNSMTNVAPLATFAVFVISAKSSGKTLNTASAYTTLSLISLLSQPLNYLIQTIPQLNAAMACLARIQTFLMSDARRDHRLPLLDNTQGQQVDEDTGAIELTDLQAPARKSLAISSVILAVKQASFAWGLELPPVLRNITFTLHRHQFCFVVGPVGSGKSTLLKGLLGETPSTQGFIYTCGPQTAFVDQSPWIRNGTIQQNVLGTSAFNESWYSEVVNCCGLDVDASSFPRGHATPVGSAGISLSGGQKQRLALARAVYAKKELIVLDDIFSGLDAQTEDHVCNALFGKDGVLRRLQVTVLFATHAVHKICYADHIVVLDNTGNISEQGSFDELQHSGGYVEGLETRKVNETSAPSHDKQEKSDTKASPVVALEAEVEELRAEELSRQTGDLAVYKHYFGSIGWRSLLRFVGSSALYGVSNKLSEYLLTFWTRAITHEGNAANNLYMGLYGLLVGLATIGLLGCVMELILVMVPSSAKTLHAQLLGTVMKAPLSFFTSTDTGSITNRFSQDMTVLDGELPYALIDLVLSGVRVIMSAVLMCLSAGYFAAIIPPVTLLVWVLQKFYLRTSRQIRLLDLEAKSPLYSHFIESLSGLVTIRAFGWGDDFLKPYYLLFCIQRWLALILDLMVMVLGVVLMALIVKLRDGGSAALAGLAILNVMSFNETLGQIITNWTQLETALGAIARLKNFSRDTPNEHLPDENWEVSEQWPTHGAIEIRNLSASYTANDTLVIRQLNLSVKAGEKIGICGRSGSGKSSLITTLFRMLEVTDDSSITIDGIDITKLPRETVRSRLNAIPQEPFFIRGSIRDNLDPRHTHDDEAAVSALKKVHLWDLVQAKGGLAIDFDLDIFSHGQRQLFCLARGILRKSKVVVLDEVTSSVDQESDKLMQAILRQEFADCTILAVAHRLDTIMDFDKILLVGNGQVKDFDTPQALMSRDSAFKALYES